jgi:hypothetical protein
MPPVGYTLEQQCICGKWMCKKSKVKILA